MNAGHVIRTMLLVGVGALALSAIARAQSEAGDPARGSDLLAQHCASCHAVGSLGLSPVVSAPAFRDLGKKYPIESLEEALAEGLSVGHEGVVQMPEFVFSPEQVGDIIAYLKSIQEHQGSPPGAR